MLIFSRIYVYFKLQAKEHVKKGRKEAISLAVLCQIKVGTLIKLCSCQWLGKHLESWIPNTESDWHILPQVYSCQFDNMWYFINEIGIFSFLKQNYSFWNEYVHSFIFEHFIFNSVIFKYVISCKNL